MVMLTDADVLKEGLRARRRKGSNATIVEWSPRLRSAIKEAQRLRAKAWDGRAEPMRPEDRLLLVNERGNAHAQRDQFSVAACQENDGR